jgi:hypothetical protein
MRLTSIFAAALAAASPAAGHVTVWPKASVPGAHEKYVVRVPNEKQADTIRIEVRFPAGLDVMSFEQKPGWRTEPLRDGAGRLIGVGWTGSLPPAEFVELGVLAVNPRTSGDLVWTAVQAFADGTRVEWSGPPASKTPAPHVTLAPAR